MPESDSKSNSVLWWKRGESRVEGLKLNIAMFDFLSFWTGPHLLHISSESIFRSFSHSISKFWSKLEECTSKVCLASCNFDGPFPQEEILWQPIIVLATKDSVLPGQSFCQKTLSGQGGTPPPLTDDPQNFFLKSGSKRAKISVFWPKIAVF